MKTTRPAKPMAPKRPAARPTKPAGKPFAKGGVVRPSKPMAPKRPALGPKTPRGIK